MFDNLVESSSHKDDISRKGSFVVATALIYGVLLLAFFVAGIYWYDNHLGEMELELTTLVAPVPVPQQQKEEPKQEAKPVKVEQNVNRGVNFCCALLVLLIMPVLGFVRKFTFEAGRWKDSMFGSSSGGSSSSDDDE